MITSQDIMRSLIAITLSLGLVGCSLWGDGKKPTPPDDSGVICAEANYDKISDKIDSRVAAAIVVAKENADDKKTVTGELSVAEAMLEAPKPDDLAWAKARAEKGDDAFYAEQVKQSRELAAAMIAAAKKYEAEKAKQKAEAAAALAEKENQLKAERLARANDRILLAAGALLVLGVVLLVTAPFATAKKLGGAFTVLGAVLGGIPFVSEEPWFKQSIGWTIGTIVMGLIAWLVLSKKKADPQKPDVTDPNAR